MIDPYEAIVLSLATGRISYAVSIDEIFRPLRERVYEISPPLDAADINNVPYRLNSDGSIEDPGWFGSLLSCPYCTSAWIALFVVVAYHVFGDAVLKVAFVFAVWALGTLYAKAVS